MPSFTDLLINDSAPWKNLYCNSLSTTTNVNVGGILIAGSASISNLVVSGPVVFSSLTTGPISCSSLVATDNVTFTGLTGTTTSFTRGVNTFVQNGTSTNIGSSARSLSVDVGSGRILISDTVGGNNLIMNSSFTQISNGSNQINISPASVTIAAGTTVANVNPTNLTISVGTNTSTFAGGLTAFQNPVIGGIDITRQKYFSGPGLQASSGGANFIGSGVQFFGVISISGGTATILASSGGVQSVVYNGIGDYTVNFIPLNPVSVLLIPMVSIPVTALAVLYAQTTTGDSFNVRVQTATVNPQPIEVLSFQYHVYRI